MHRILRHRALRALRSSRPRRALPLLMLFALAGAIPAASQVFEEYPHTVEAPYAGRYEARIGGSSEPEGEKLRLDIGASIDILTLRDSTMPAGTISRERNRLSIGADFFTWSRLRSQPDFKFPVEAIDYYFGVNAAIRLARIGGHQPLVSQIRIRAAHISAHLVDGDTAVTSSAGFAPTTYSREFVDVMLAADGERLARAIGSQSASVRPYVGALWIFHDIPEVASPTTLYAGIDGYIVPLRALPLVIKGGYELRMNSEIEPTKAEHQLRAGVKIGEPHSNGVILETAWYSGRSMYGQHFGADESYLSIGFAIDY